MAVKILVVEDSATMRKIMEMTFAGENAQVVTIPEGESAVAKAEELKPDVVFADVSNKVDAYAVAQSIKTHPGLANVAVVALSSQHASYDAAKGQAAGIDDHVVKPFDTQAVIDKLASVLARPRTQPSGGVARPASAAPAPGMVPPPAPRPPIAPVAPPPAAAAAAGRDLKRTMAFGTPLAPIANPVGPVQGAPAAPVPPPAAAKPSLDIVEEPVPLTTPRAPAPAPQAPAAAPAIAAPAPVPPAPVVPKQPVAAPVAPAASVATAAAAAVTTSGLEQKLAGLGLSKAQIEGVLALSREVVEQVVWEVVPDLAETIIREEIKRLTS